MIKASDLPILSTVSGSDVLPVSRDDNTYKSLVVNIKLLPEPGTMEMYTYSGATAVNVQLLDGGTTDPAQGGPFWVLCDGGGPYSGTGAVNGDIWSGFYAPLVNCRTPLCAGQGSGLTLRTFGDTGGAETVSLTTSQMATHFHNFWITDEGSGTAPGLPDIATDPSGSANVVYTDNSGSGASHPNMHNYNPVFFIIRTPRIV